MSEQPEALRMADQLEWADKRDVSSLGLRIKAAAELRRLHEINQELLRLVKRYRAETPLGHQPHMIAHEADAAIAKGEQA